MHLHFQSYINGNVRKQEGIFVATRIFYRGNVNSLKNDEILPKFKVD